MFENIKQFSISNGRNFGRIFYPTCLLERTIHLDNPPLFLFSRMEEMVDLQSLSVRISSVAADPNDDVLFPKHLALLSSMNLPNLESLVMFYNNDQAVELHELVTRAPNLKHLAIQQLVQIDYGDFGDVANIYLHLASLSLVDIGSSQFSHRFQMLESLTIGLHDAYRAIQFSFEVLAPLENLINLELFSIERLWKIASMPNLRDLKISNCPDLCSIENCLLLERMDVRSCGKFTKIDVLPSLKKAIINDCELFTTILHVQNLECLDVRFESNLNSELPRILSVSETPRLTQLTWRQEGFGDGYGAQIQWDCKTTNLQNVHFLNQSVDRHMLNGCAMTLTKLALFNCRTESLFSLRHNDCDPDVFIGLRVLKELTLVNCKLIHEIPVLESLEYLSIRDCKFDKSCCFVKPIPGMPNLTTLELVNLPQLVMLLLPKDMPCLTTLTIENCHKLRTVSPEVLVNLQKLSVLNCCFGCDLLGGEFHLSQLAHCRSLLHLHLRGCQRYHYLPRDFDDWITPLKNTLETLILDRYGMIPDIQHFNRLWRLNICDSIVRYIGHMPNLKVLMCLLRHGRLFKMQPDIEIEDLPVVEDVDIRIDSSELLCCRPINGIYEKICM